MIQGITITLCNEIEVGKDDFDQPIYEYQETEVENILVAPASTSEVLGTLNLTGRKAVYTIAIPKGDNHIWENQKVKFFNEEWRVFGLPQRGIDEMIPLQWNEKWQVERYE